MAGKMSMTIHLLLQLWSPFVFCSHNHFSDCFQWFTDGSLLAILILPIILAFFCWTMRPDMHGIDTHRLHLMLLLIHTCELQQGFGHPKKMIQVVLADDPEAINDTSASRIYIYPDEPPDPYTVHLWRDLTGPVGHGPVATRDTAIEAGDRQSPQAPQPAASSNLWFQRFLPLPLPKIFLMKPVMLLHGLCRLPAFVTFMAFIEFFFGGVGGEGGWSYGMPRCLQEVEVLDLDWGPMRSPLESLPFHQFHTMGLLLYAVFHHHTFDFLSFTLYIFTHNMNELVVSKIFLIFSTPWFIWGRENSHFQKSIFFSDGLVKKPTNHHRSSEPSKLLHLTVALPRLVPGSCCSGWTLEAHPWFGFHIGNTYRISMVLCWFP